MMLFHSAVDSLAATPLASPPGGSAPDGGVEARGDAAASGDLGARLADLEAERRAERRRLRWAAGVAVAGHLALLAVTLPQWARETEFTAPVRAAFVVEPVRFKPPPPRAAEATPPPQEKVKRIPIPDPTPDAPEPLVDPRELLVVPPLQDLEGDFLGIPEAPPGIGPATVDGQVPLEVGGEVQAPVRVHSPSPLYTEEARLARVQGVVILRTVIDTRGDVVDAEVVKGLPQGLSEAALETVRQWKFQPATKNGEPVPVFFFLTISFHVQ